MRLSSVEISHFKHILNSTCVDIQDDITCLVGKNESGKTAFLEALRRLNPAQRGVEFNVRKQYPAWLEKLHRRQGQDLEAIMPVSVVFELDDDDIHSMESEFGKGVIKSNKFEISRRYDNAYRHTLDSDERVAVDYFLSSQELPQSLADKLPTEKSFADLRTTIAEYLADDDLSDEERAVASELEDSIDEYLPKGENFNESLFSKIFERVPVFFFFSEYSTLPSRIDIRALVEADPEDLDDDDVTAQALLQMAGSEDEYLLDPDYETRKRELENVANAITQDVMAELLPICWTDFGVI